MAVRIAAEGKEDGSDGPHDHLTIEDTITEPGYVYVYLSNDGEGVSEVYFDDFKVEHVKSPLVQSQDFYPFGMAFGNYQRENSMNDKYQYGGKELQSELSLGWLDYGPRMYMSDLGRWGVPDPLADIATEWTPYRFSFDNPIRFSDPSGLSETDGNGNFTYTDPSETANVLAGFKKIFGTGSNNDTKDEKKSDDQGPSVPPALKLKNATFMDIVGVFAYAHDQQWKAADEGKSEEFGLNIHDLFDPSGMTLANNTDLGGSFYDVTFDLGKGKGTARVRILFPTNRKVSRIASSSPFYAGNDSNNQIGFAVDVNKAKAEGVAEPYAAAMFSMNLGAGRLATIGFTNKEAFIKWRSLIYFHEKRMADLKPDKPIPRSKY